MGSNEEQLKLEVTPESEAAEKLEAMASQEEAEQQAEAAPDELTGEIVPASGEIKARAFLGVMSGTVQLLEPRIVWPEQVYSEGAEKLGPVFDKYDIGNSIGGRYLEEINAGFFVAGLVVGTFRQVSALKAEDAKKAKKEEAEPKREPQAGPAAPVQNRMAPVVVS